MTDDRRTSLLEVEPAPRMNRHRSFLALESETKDSSEAESLLMFAQRKSRFLTEITPEGDSACDRLPTQSVTGASHERGHSQRALAPFLRQTSPIW